MLLGFVFQYKYFVSNITAKYLLRSFSIKTFQSLRCSKEMTSKTAKQVRQDFIDFFVKKYDHIFVPSSSTIPHEDPTLLFANAGMNQFKSLFLGTADPNSDFAKLKRVVNSQKCIRAGGKHNDLDDVGKDVYHHTFFEMMGNWSFGDFFKKEIIAWSWELLTDVWGLEKERFYVTYFGGADGVPADEEAKQFWLELGLPPNHVLPFGMKENFWEMGETGPCGPCSELHYDRIGGRDASNLVNMDVPDVLEVWNLVFIQFNREVDGQLVPLPNQHVDTGLGLERIISVLQNKMSNYDTDVFTPYFDAIHQATGIKPYLGLVGPDDKDGVDMAYRVIADHIRTLTVALSDGGRPDNVGRGYVLRRILRRAVRFATEKLNCKPGVFASLVDVVCTSLGSVYPNILKDPQTIKDIINEEESQFLKTLARGRRLFNRTADKTTDGIIAGDLAWRLYDTYGFPSDLTILMAEERNLKVDMVGYEVLKAKAQEMARARGSEVEDIYSLDVHAIDELKTKGFVQTDESPKYNYEKDEHGNYVFQPTEAIVTALRVNKQFVDEVTNGKCGVLLDRTSFYAEQGGQLFDTGYINLGEEVEFAVNDVQIHGGYVLHVGNLVGTLKVGDKVTCSIDESRRRSLMNNHTATHLLNFALRKVLVDDADQRGSLVAPDKLRFDFTAKGALSSEQVKMTEDITREIIKQDQKVFASASSLAVAKNIQGLRAIFDEVYPDPVRVISIGYDLKDLINDPQAGYKTSVEFCGGTHLKSTGDVVEFAIVSEEAISKGIRRIVSLTGSDALKAHKRANQLASTLNEFSEYVEVQKNNNTLNMRQLSQQIAKITEEISESLIPAWCKHELREKLKSIKKHLDDTERMEKASRQNRVIEKASEIATLHLNEPFIVQRMEDGCNAKALDAALKSVKAVAPNLSAMLFSVDTETNTVICLCQVPQNVVDNTSLKANEWVKEVSTVIGGKGGGKPISAQGSGDKMQEIDKAVEVAKSFASLKLQ
ncbi:alanine--tRNA ligase, cytoplasmic [Hydra vulgaris]|uniref:alanine--tRNA ligase, cytoplasmic n=1 Tax=Hydra vulgaris TaxID=6087 RepID=UPI001F5F3E76|nr:alanine--tRNA ligase, cytoplasmic [Hydra vulgaris]